MEMGLSGFLVICVLWNFTTAMSRLTKSMCWDLVVVNKDRLNGVGAAIYRKPISNECYLNRSRNEPPVCSESDDPNAAWYYFVYFLLYLITVVNLLSAQE